MYRLSEFIIQLYSILEEYQPIISWSDNHKSFIIIDSNHFTHYVLPNFSDVDFETFKNQLKQHGFQLVSNNKNVWEFQHPIYHRHFLQDPIFKSMVDTKSKINQLSISQRQLKNKIYKKHQKQQQIQTILHCMKKNLKNQNNEIEQWLQSQLKKQKGSRSSFSSTLPAAIQAIEKIKHEEEKDTKQDELSGVTLPTCRYQLPSSSLSNRVSFIEREKKRWKMTQAWSVPPRVLLVDDDSIFRAISTQLLQYAGCNIEVAVDGMDALNKVTKGLGYDIVLMDIMMPNLDGISATRSIRQHDHWTPIISMSSNMSDLDVQTYKMNGMTDILEKPLNQYTLFNLLKRYCAHLVQQQQQESIIIPK